MSQLQKIEHRNTAFIENDFLKEILQLRSTYMACFKSSYINVTFCIIYVHIDANSSFIHLKVEIVKQIITLLTDLNSHKLQKLCDKIQIFSIHKQHLPVRYDKCWLSRSVFFQNCINDVIG